MKLLSMPPFLRRLCVMAIMFVTLRVSFPDFTLDLLIGSMFEGMFVWKEDESAVAPDGRLVAISEWMDKGAAGWGPRRVVVTPTEDLEDKTTVYVSPTRSWGLEVRWAGPRLLEVVARTNREATVRERREAKDSFKVEGQRFNVQVVFQEPGSK